MLRAEEILLPRENTPLFIQHQMVRSENIHIGIIQIVFRYLAIYTYMFAIKIKEKITHEFEKEKREM